MEQIVINLYSATELRELNPKAFEHAYWDWLSNWEFGWWKEVEEVIVEFNQRFGVELDPNFDFPRHTKVGVIELNEYYDNTLGGYVIHTSEDIVGQKLVSWLLEHHFHDIYEGKYYFTRGYYDENRKYHYKHRRSKTIFEERILGGVCYGADIMGPIHELIRNRRNISDSYSLTDLFRDCAISLATSVADEIEYQQTEEAFIESSEANNWKYEENGELRY